MTSADPQVVAAMRLLAEEAIASAAPRPPVLGLCGAQGSGKSTLAAALAAELAEEGLVPIVLSIDDLYLRKSERELLARNVHPLLATRGPPGTHDVALGLHVLDSLIAGTHVVLPRFDKAGDDRSMSAARNGDTGQCDIVIFEGWCVGARPQAANELTLPLNALESEEDPYGIWRSFVNDALAGPYQDLFARIDRLAMLEAPGFEIVFEWRLQQEDELRATSGGEGVMDARQIARFIQHYERITRHILKEMPARADLLIRLDRERKPVCTLAHNSGE